MSDKMYPLSFPNLLNWILTEYKKKNSIFGIHKKLFYKHDTDLYSINKFGSKCETPLGVSAGPHTQMAQNIICAWLSGARFIELKTVQLLDNINVSKPCIDIQDEGYNVEWSQELSLSQSYKEYLHSWVLLHILKKYLYPEKSNTEFGCIFNMSVGYDLKGIKSEPVNNFINRMMNAKDELDEIRKIIQSEFSQFSSIDIPDKISNSVTISTMHGCPPEEIEKIAKYLISEKGLNTYIKLNPTLLGKEQVLDILHNYLGFKEIQIEHAVFTNDLQYGMAVDLIKSLKSYSNKHDLEFGVKLSNTLPVSNHRNVFQEKEMYMSGRSLFPITINLAYKIMKEFDSDLNISYCGGADAFNFPEIIKSSLCPVTVASDLLKPGGYSRLVQYLENLRKDMESIQATNLDDYILKTGNFDGEAKVDKSLITIYGMANLKRLAYDSIQNPKYKKEYYGTESPKIESKLPLFDCVSAPCITSCPISQNIPEYIQAISDERFNDALKIIRETNPLPTVCGYVCDHKCVIKCTRRDYDNPLNIKSLKRFASENGKTARINPDKTKDIKIAIIGSGPSGLSAAYFLALKGYNVTVFESRAKPGGMLRYAIPCFRLPEYAIETDIEWIKDIGVKFVCNTKIESIKNLTIRVSSHSSDKFAIAKEKFDYIYLALGSQKEKLLNIDGENSENVYSALDFLSRVKQGEKLQLGNKVIVIGGGNTAIDSAMSALRKGAKEVKIVCLEKRDEMPAFEDEIEEAISEGIIIENSLGPVHFIQNKGLVTEIEFQRCISVFDDNGRFNPKYDFSMLTKMKTDTVIVAIGQDIDTDFFSKSDIVLNRNRTVKIDELTYRTNLKNVFAGGDVVRGANTVIKAIADGKDFADRIYALITNQECEKQHSKYIRKSDEEILELKIRRAKKIMPIIPKKVGLDNRHNFNVVQLGFTKDDAISESKRCLACNALCEKCVELCPNRANIYFEIQPITARLSNLIYENGLKISENRTSFKIEQHRQILHINALCNECGNCETFCPHNGAPYKDKLTIFFRKDEFANSDNTGFILHKHNNDWLAECKVNGQFFEIKFQKDKKYFEVKNSEMNIKILKNGFRIIESQIIKKPDNTKIYSILNFVFMYYTVNGIIEYAPEITGNIYQ